MSDEKCVGSIATAKMVALIKAETAKKYDKTGGKIKGSAEITGDLQVAGYAECGALEAQTYVKGDAMVMSPVIMLDDVATDVYLSTAGDGAAKMTITGADADAPLARLKVATPTGDDDAATKAYVDGHREVITVTSTKVSDLGYDAAEGATKYSVTFDASFDSILANLAANKPMKFNITIPDDTGGFPLSFTTGYFSALNNGMFAFTGSIAGAPIVLSIGGLGSATVYIYADYLPAPNPDGSDDGKSLAVAGNKWAIKKAAIDDVLSDTSTNPVQNKVVKAALDKKAGKDVATAEADGLMSAVDKVKLDGIEDGATKTIIDDAMSDTSTNPVQNKVVMEYIDSHGTLPPVSVKNDTMLIQVVNGAYALRTKESIFPVDDALDTESKNAVENGVIARRFEQLSGAMLPATSKRDGLMTAANYTKLSGIEAGATKTIVDATLDETSTNPVQNKAVKTALDGKAGTAEATTGAAGLMSSADKVKLDGVEDGATKTIVDDAMSDTSTNPVQNKAVKAALDGKLSTQGGEILGHLSVGLTVSAEGSVSTGRTSTDTGIHFEKAASDAGRISHGSDPMTGVSPIARLKVASPTEDDDAATKSYVDNNAAGGGAVRYDAAQTLDGAQQGQARTNIGAIGHDSPQFAGYLSLAPANAPLGTGVGLSPIGSGNNFTLDISDVNENTPTLLTGVKTPTDADTNAAATVEYVKNKVSEVAASGGVDVDNALSATSANPVQNKVITSALAKKAGTAVATESANGLMSKADKTKLDGIAAGATKITIDSAMSGSSNNPVANHVVKQYVDDKVAAAGSNITVDSTLSDTSTNPVQNKAVKAALDGKLSTSGGTLTGNLTGKYITGTWLRSTEASDLGRTPGKIAVLDDSGWVYYRTPSELFADLGITNAIKSYVDAAIVAAINSAY